MTCKETLERSWVYNCGTCSCNRWNLTLSCNVEKCTYYEEEIKGGDCDTKPSSSESWDKPCTLSGEFSVAAISQNVDGTFCEMGSTDTPIFLNAGEFCSSEVTEIDYAVYARFSPDLKEETLVETLDLYISNDGGKKFDALRIAMSNKEQYDTFEERSVDAMRYRQETCKDCIEAQATCPGNPFIPMNSFSLSPTGAPSMSQAPSSSPSDVYSPRICKLGKEVGEANSFARDTVVAVISASTGPWGGAAASITGGAVTLMYNLSCKTTGKKTVPEMVAERVRSIAREQAKEQIIKDKTAMLRTNADQIWWEINEAGGMVRSRLEYFAARFNEAEEQAVSIGIAGVDVLVSAAAMKLYLIGMWKDNSGTKECCTYLANKYRKSVRDTRDRLNNIESQFNKYESTWVKYRDTLRPIKRIVTDDCWCYDCGYTFSCCYPWEAWWVAPDGSKPVSTEDSCIGGKEDIDRAMKGRLISNYNSFFGKLRQELFGNLQRVRELINQAADQKLPDCSNFT